jgi:hypothetical protein
MLKHAGLLQPGITPYDLTNKVGLLTPDDL